MNLISLTQEREEIIKQFPIPDRDEHIYTSINEAVEDSLRRSFKDINFRTMTETTANKSIKRVLNQINGSKKIKMFNVATVMGQEEKEAITELINRLHSGLLKYDDCKITEYLIACLINNNFVNRFVEFFNCNTYKSKPGFDEWHHETAKIFLNVLKKYYDKAYYGKAQKIVNMMFKHLYCMNFAHENACEVLREEYFEHCHMPLDSFTLDWIHRKDKEAVCEWSNLEYAPSSTIPSTSYTNYLTRVNALFPIGSSQTAFQAEFYIWPQMQFTQAFETIYRMNHSKSDAEKFRNYNISTKCKEIISEINGINFTKSFI